MKHSHRIQIAVIVMILATLACNLPSPQAPVTQDPNLAFTAAAATVSAKLTESALQNQVEIQPSATLVPPSPTSTIQAVANTIQPPPTTAFATIPPSPTSVSSCDQGLFIQDVTVPDNMVMTPGQAFTKTWRIKNNGTCTWSTSYDVIFASGNQMSAPSEQALTGSVAPGQTIDISVNMVAPATNGTYTGYWKLRNAAGVNFSSFYVQIKVEGGSSGGSGGAFAVTSVQFSVTGSCPNFHYKFKITVNGAGTVTYHRVFSDGGTDTNPGTLTFSAAGSQIVEYDRYFGIAGSTAWTDIYIDSPNHQQFGRAYFTCP